MAALSHFYRNQLLPSDQLAYDFLCEGIGRRQREIRTPPIQEYARLVTAINYDHPEFFYVNWLDAVQFRIGGGTEIMCPPYIYSGGDMEYIHRRICEIADECPGISDRGKAQAVHDWFVRHITYDQAGLQATIRSPGMFSAAGPIIAGAAVCEGISKLACCLLRNLRVDCRLVTGLSAGGIPHAWISLLADGELVYSDITYDMGLYTRSGEIPRRYFHISRTAMERDHIFRDKLR